MEELKRRLESRRSSLSGGASPQPSPRRSSLGAGMGAGMANGGGDGDDDSHSRLWGVQLRPAEQGAARGRRHSCSGRIETASVEQADATAVPRFPPRAPQLRPSQLPPPPPGLRMASTPSTVTAPPRLFDEPPLGQSVVLRGLSSRPDLNGQRGVVWSFEGGRYTVAIEGGGETVRVRPANLSAEPEGAASTSAPMLRARATAARPANAPHGAPKKLVAGGASSAAGGDAARQSSRRERDGASGPAPDGGARWARWNGLTMD